MTSFCHALQISTLKSNKKEEKRITSSIGVLFEIFPPFLYVAVEELFELCSSLLQWVVGCQGEDAHVLKGKSQTEQAFVQLDSKA